MPKLGDTIGKEEEEEKEVDKAGKSGHLSQWNICFLLATLHLTFNLTLIFIIIFKFCCTSCPVSFFNLHLVRHLAMRNLIMSQQQTVTVAAVCCTEQEPEPMFRSQEEFTGRGR